MLPLNEVTIATAPREARDLNHIHHWMEEENKRSIDSGHGVLYKPLNDQEIHDGLAEKRLLFFYLEHQLLGFIRLLHFREGYWEVRSAISSPRFRKEFTGFNLLFQSAALLHIDRLAPAFGLPRSVLIVTYHIEVARSIQRQMDHPAQGPLLFKGSCFDYSLIKELICRPDDPLLLRLNLQTRAAERLPFFIFDITACLQGLA